MSIPKYFLLSLLTNCLASILAQRTTSGPHGKACTSHAEVDLYILFDLGQTAEIQRVESAFDFVKSLMDVVDPRNTRVAVSVGDNCNFVVHLYLRPGEVDFYRKLAHTCIPSELDDAELQFNFSKHEYPTSKRHELKLDAIKASIDVMKRRITTEHPNVSRLGAREAATFATSVDWLKKLATIKRKDAELAVLVVTLEPATGRQDWYDARNALHGVPWLAIKICPIKGDCALTYLTLAQTIKLKFSETVRRRIGILWSLCVRLHNCHYYYNETVRRAILCRWDQDGRCKKDHTGLLVILKAAIGNGSPCPKIAQVICKDAECDTTCDKNDTSQWTQWGECSPPCGSVGMQFKKRVALRPKLSLSCNLEAMQLCRRQESCTVPVMTKDQYSMTTKKSIDQYVAITESVGDGFEPIYFIVTVFLIGALSLMILVGCIVYKRYASSRSAASKSKSSMTETKSITLRPVNLSPGLWKFGAKKTHHLTLPTLGMRKVDKMSATGRKVVVFKKKYTIGDVKSKMGKLTLPIPYSKKLTLSSQDSEDKLSMPEYE